MHYEFPYAALLHDRIISDATWWWYIFNLKEIFGHTLFYILVLDQFPFGTKESKEGVKHNEFVNIGMNIKENVFEPFKWQESKGWMFTWLRVALVDVSVF